MRVLPIKLIILSILLSATAVRGASYPELDGSDMSWIAGQIFNNECNRQISCLTSWNSGEDFPSLGIGHFIWYRSGQQEIFNESFPQLLEFLAANNVQLPEWIRTSGFESPWQNREAFLAAFDSSEMEQLRSLLFSQMELQTAFIIRRFENALPILLSATDEHSRTLLENRFEAVAGSAPPYGMYALIDYINFKGEGVSPAEQYRGQGWGLLQVLENMSAENQDPLQAFVTSAREILERRVMNSPAQRNEAQWLTGWNKRLDTYLPRSDY